MSRRRRGLNYRPQPCLDCGVDTLDMGGRQEAYLVHDEVWAAAGMDGSRRFTPPGEIRVGSEGEPRLFEMPPILLVGEFLCVGCIERRLGRQLTQVNIPRLESRLAGS
jgi:hypothetical protein